MMKRPTVLQYCVLCGCIFFCLGMGSKRDNKIPVPAENFSGTIIDRAGVHTSGSDLSIEGRTFITINHGKGLLYIEFKDIKTVQFAEPGRDSIDVTITLISGETITGTLNAIDYVYGRAQFGTFKIKIREIVSLTFDSQH